MEAAGEADGTTDPVGTTLGAADARTEGSASGLGAWEPADDDDGATALTGDGLAFATCEDAEAGAMARWLAPGVPEEDPGAELRAMTKIRKASTMSPISSA